MSDPKSSYGEPVEEPTTVDDVVEQAHEGLADAEAAGRDAVETPAEAEIPAPEAADADAAAPDVAETPAAGAPETPAAEAPEAPAAEAPDTDAAHVPSAENEWAAELPSWAVNAPLDDEPVAEPTAVIAAEPAVDPLAETAIVEAPLVTGDEPTTAYEPVVAPSEPVVPAAVAPQPIFVQAPEPPRLRGNRAAAGAIGLLAAVAFAIVYLGASLGFGAIAGDVTAENVGTEAVAALTSWALWVPVAVFFIAFWLLGAIINRGRWGTWVIVGLLVGFASYGGHLLGQLFQAPFWMLTASQGLELVEGQLLAPLAVVSLVIGRELTIWFGAWAAARGKRVTELNVEAMREYERTLEAGPQLVRP